MFNYDLQLVNQGYRFIACVDEVGRGCLFGDVVACAIVMPYNVAIEGVADSKKLSAKKRLILNKKILEQCIAVGIGQSDVSVIEQVNIKNATQLAMVKALENLTTKTGDSIIPDLILVDAEKIKYREVPVLSIIKGDDTSYGIGCASIVAKVHRDSLCEYWDEQYPGYFLKKNKGYGTKEHRNAILEKGYTDMHRRSFLRKILGGVE